MLTMRDWSRTVKRLVRPARRAVADNSLVAERAAMRDWRQLIGELSAPAGERRSHLLIPSTGNRNTGDQAMLDSFLQSVSAPVTVVTHDASTYDTSYAPGSTVFAPIPGLLMGTSSVHEAALSRLADLLRSHRTLTIIGADIVDGGYQRRVSARLWAVAGAAADSGIATRVLGFSWRAGVEPRLRRIATAATEAGVQGLVRDPRSFARARADGLRHLTQTADVAFALPDPPASSERMERRLALLNVSGLIRSRVNLLRDYQQILTWLVGAGFDVVLVPHVASNDASDVQAADELWNSLAEGDRAHVTRIQRLMSPAESKLLAQTATVIVTGRMHLSILGASVGVPSVVLTTQGKVDGLLEMLEMPEWAVAPESGMATRVIQLLSGFLASPEAVTAALIQRREALRRLALRNYEGL